LILTWKILVLDIAYWWLNFCWKRQCESQVDANYASITRASELLARECGVKVSSSSSSSSSSVIDLS